MNPVKDKDALLETKIRVLRDYLETKWMHERIAAEVLG